MTTPHVVRILKLAGRPNRRQPWLAECQTCAWAEMYLSDEEAALGAATHEDEGG